MPTDIQGQSDATLHLAAQLVRADGREPWVSAWISSCGGSAELPQGELRAVHPDLRASAVCRP